VGLNRRPDRARPDTLEADRAQQAQAEKDERDACDERAKCDCRRVRPEVMLANTSLDPEGDSR
jgi:hypothetical protein